MQTTSNLMRFIVLMLIFSGILVSCNSTNKASDAELMVLNRINTSTHALLQAFELAPDKRLWISGHNSTYGWSDAPYTDWTFETVKGIDTLLQFRDIAVTNKARFLMSAGNGALSRIYRAENDKGPWVEVYRGDREDVFIDSIDFFDDQHGLAYGDSFDGQLFLLQTQDGGQTWTLITPDLLPAALEGEGGFAASGTCIEVVDTQTALIATGNASKARLLITKDRGLSWKAIELDLIAGSAAGATGVKVDGSGIAWVFGGDLNRSTTEGLRIQRYDLLTDSLYLPSEVLFRGAIYGFDARTNSSSLDKTSDWIVAANPNGLYVNSVISPNSAWRQVDSLSYWAVVSVENHIFAAGPKGRISKLELNAKASTHLKLE